NPPSPNNQAALGNPNAIDPTTLGGSRNFILQNPLPYVLTSQLLIGQDLTPNANGGTPSFVGNRLYVAPGMIVKSVPGAGIGVVSSNASINVGDQTYINEYDEYHAFGPSTPGFVAEPSGAAPDIFTSLYDAAATTAYLDPITQQSTTIVPPTDTANNGGANQPTATNVPS